MQLEMQKDKDAARVHALLGHGNLPVVYLNLIIWRFVKWEHWRKPYSLS